MILLLMANGASKARRCCVVPKLKYAPFVTHPIRLDTALAARHFSARETFAPNQSNQRTVPNRISAKLVFRCCTCATDLLVPKLYFVDLSYVSMYNQLILVVCLSGELV
jgi:hypothetical protein